MFKGSFVAITTPFIDNKIDEDALRKLVRFHIENGTNGIVPCGTIILSKQHFFLEIFLNLW